jgi:tRNA(Ile)-lysidine synthase
MFRDSAWRAGMNLPLRKGDCVVVRNRRAGDRVQPLGCDFTRRLKDVLMDRRVPRRHRDRLPLLEVDSRIAWVPGVMVDHRFRLHRPFGAAWIVELEPL